jgi:hypothetical protein
MSACGRSVKRQNSYVEKANSAFGLSQRKAVPARQLDPAVADGGCGERDYDLGNGKRVHSPFMADQYRRGQIA